MEDKKELLDRVSAFILDCDGVVWRGDKVIEGVPETLDWLRAQVCASASPALHQGVPDAEPAELATAHTPEPAERSRSAGLLRAASVQFAPVNRPGGRLAGQLQTRRLMRASAGVCFQLRDSLAAWTTHSAAAFGTSCSPASEAEALMVT